MSEPPRPETDPATAVLADLESTSDLLAYAEAMEREAAERYAELADQMAGHNNPEVANLFAKLAEIEGAHAGRLERRLPAASHRRAPWEYRWLDPEGPETASLDRIHYLMTPRHALKLALHNEERARDFYALVAERVDDPDVRALAEEFAEEEEGHVALVRGLLDKFPEPPEDWDYDPDPPMTQE